MKFLYAYRDSANERHDGSVTARSRDDAFARLRADGIRPFFVAPAPGLWNRLQALGKRGWVIVALVVALAAVLVALVGADHRADRMSEEIKATFDSPLTRRQVYGDAALLERLEAEDYAPVFTNAGDRVLAHFARPTLIDRYVTNLRRDPAAFAAAVAALEGRITRPACPPDARAVAPRPPESSPAAREYDEFRRIVRWMRGEFAAYLANGNGTPASYLRRLIERQIQEAQLYARYQRELKDEKDPSVWDEKNTALRAIGAPTIPMPLDFDPAE